MPYLRRAILSAALLSLPLLAAACSFVPAAGRGDLPTTLSFQDEPGGPVAFQYGQPVPTFDWEPRLRAELDGAWRFDPEPLDTNLSLSSRDMSMPGLQAEMGSRAAPSYDDASWSQVTVPGSFNPPPNKSITGGYFRRDFELPTERIALRPAVPRDAARLLLVRPGAEPLLEDRSVRDLPGILRPGDALVVNDTKVIPARLTGRRIGRGEAEP